MDEESDEALAMRAASGCRASFSQLIARRYDAVYKLAWRWTGSRSSGEDIAQDVAVKLAHAIRGYRGYAKFGTWLHRLAYTTTIDFLRASQRMAPADPSEITRLIDRSAATQDVPAVPAEDLWTAVRQLPEKQRDAVLLVYGEEMSHADAAAIMGCSEKTVSWHVHEAKKRLRTLLEAVG